MKQHAKKVFKNPLFYGSTIVVTGSLVANFFNFLFNVFMTRNLSNADYGILASVISIISLPALMASAIVPLVIQFAGKYFAQNKLDYARGFYHQIMKYFIIFGAILFFGFIFAIPLISNFLHIHDFPLFLLTACTILLGVINIINVAFIQAKLAFLSQVVINLLGAIAKVIIGAIFVYLGFHVNGALGAIFLSALIAYLISFVPIRFIFAKHVTVPKVETKELYAYAIPSTLTLVGLTSFITMDIILVKHFFEPNIAGMYASIALIGRVIFYIASPIGSVMFPLIVQRYSNKENITTIFMQSLFLVLIPSILLTIVYFVFPNPTILFFTKKSENLLMSPYLGYMGLYMTNYVVLFIITNFYLSIKKTRVYIPILIAAAAQILLMCIFHASLLQIIIISLAITSSLVIFFVFHYYFKLRNQF